MVIREAVMLPNWISQLQALRTIVSPALQLRSRQAQSEVFQPDRAGVRRENAVLTVGATSLLLVVGLCVPAFTLPPWGPDALGRTESLSTAPHSPPSWGTCAFPCSSGSPGSPIKSLMAFGCAQRVFLTYRNLMLTTHWPKGECYRFYGRVTQNLAPLPARTVSAGVQSHALGVGVRPQGQHVVVVSQ